MIKKMTLSLLTGLMFVNAAPLQALDAKDVAKKTAFAALFALNIRFWTREATNDPVRYNLDELFANVNVKENCFYLLDDGLIGHPGKDSTLKFDEATGGIPASKKVMPKGLGGFFHSYFKKVATAFGTTVAFMLLYETLTEKSKTSFLETFIANVAKYAESGKRVFVKLSDLGVGYLAPAEIK